MNNTGIYAKAAELFPEPYGKKLTDIEKLIEGSVREIRLYKNSPVLLVTDRGDYFIKTNGGLINYYAENTLKSDLSLMQRVIYKAAECSLFKFEKELSEGYITVKNGIRIGICCYSAEKGFTLDSVTSVNIRLPYYSTDKPSFDFFGLINQGGLLIAGPPMSGKTSVLKECCRALCDTRTGLAQRVSIVDKTGELSEFSGKDEFYLADIISMPSKAEAIMRAVRYMSPRYIVCDEIGTSEECTAMLEGMNSGVVFIVAVHSGNIRELVRKDQFAFLFRRGIFENAVFLSARNPGKPVKIFGREEITDEINKYNSAVFIGDCDRNEYNFKSVQKKNGIEIPVGVFSDIVP